MRVVRKSTVIGRSRVLASVRERLAKHPVDPSAVLTGEPLVSVVVTFHNQAAYVAETLTTALEQDYRNLEVIAVDDGSRDDTVGQCARFGKRVRVVSQRKQGPSAARNTGIRLARGPLVAFLDGDDLWEPDKLTAQVNAAQRFPEAGLIVVDGIQFSAGDRNSSTIISASADPILRGSSADVVSAHCYDRFLESNFVWTSSQMMIPAWAFDRVGLWDTQLARAGDYELYLRLSACFPVAIVRRRLCRYRYVASSLSGAWGWRGLNNGLWAIRVLRVHRQWADPATHAVIDRRITRWARECARDASWRVLEIDKPALTKYLLRLAATSRRPHVVLPFVLRVWAPQRVRELAKRLRPPRPAPEEQPRPH